MGFHQRGRPAAALAGDGPSNEQLGGGLGDEDNDFAPYSQGFLCSGSQAAAARTDAVIAAAFRRLMRPDMQLARAIRLAEIADLPEQRDALDALDRARRLTPPCPTCGSRGWWWERAIEGHT
jgi:hypothetical protein